MRNELESLGIQNRRGRPWSKTSIDHILRNPVYAGKIRFENCAYSGEHKAIIEQDTFENAQKMRRLILHPKTKITRPFLLKGLIKCSDCGSAMTPHYTQKKRANGEPYYVYYYRCTRTMHYRNSVCQIKHINANEIERLVIDYLDSLTKNDDFLKKSVNEINEDIESRIEPLKKEIILYRKRLDEIETEIENLVQGIAKGRISVGILEKVLEKHQHEKKDLEDRITSIKHKIQSHELQGFDSELIRKNLQDFKKVFNALEDKDKARCMQLILRDVIVYKDKIVVNVFELPEFVGSSQNRQIRLPQRDSNSCCRRERAGTGIKKDNNLGNKVNRKVPKFNKQSKLNRNKPKVATSPYRSWRRPKSPVTI